MLKKCRPVIADPLWLAYLLPGYLEEVTQPERIL